MSTPASNAAASPPQLSLALGLPPPHQSFKRSFQQFGLDVDGEDEHDLGHVNNSGDNSDSGGPTSNPASSASVSSNNFAERERGEQRNKRARSSDFRSDDNSDEGGSETSGSDNGRRIVGGNRGELDSSLSSSASLSSSSYSSPSSSPYRNNGGEGPPLVQSVTQRLPTPLVLPVVSPVASLSFEPRTPSVAEFVAERLNQVSSNNSSPNSATSFTSALTSLSPPANIDVNRSEEETSEDLEEELEVSSEIHQRSSPVLLPVPFANGSSLNLDIAFEEFQGANDDETVADDEEGDNEDDDGEDQLLEDDSGDIQMSEVEDMATEGALGDPIDPDRRSSSAPSLGFRIPSPPLPDPLEIPSDFLPSSISNSGPSATTSRLEAHVSSPRPSGQSTRLRDIEEQIRTSMARSRTFDDNPETSQLTSRFSHEHRFEHRLRTETPPRLPVPQIDGGSLEDALSLYNRLTSDDGASTSSLSTLRLRHRPGPVAPPNLATASGVQIPHSSRRSVIGVRSRVLPPLSRRPSTPPQLFNTDSSSSTSHHHRRAPPQLNDPLQDESTSVWMNRFLSTMDDHRDRIMTRLREEQENHSDLRGFLEDLNSMIQRFEPPTDLPFEREVPRLGETSVNERGRSSVAANEGNGGSSGSNRSRTDANPPLRERIDVLLNQLDSPPPLLPLNLPTSRAVSPLRRVPIEPSTRYNLPVDIDDYESSDSDLSWSRNFRDGLVDTTVSSADREIWDDVTDEMASVDGEDHTEDLRAFRAGSTPAPTLVPHRQSLPSLRDINPPFPSTVSPSVTFRSQVERSAAQTSHWSSGGEQQRPLQSQNDNSLPPVLPLDLDSLRLPSFFPENQSLMENTRHVEGESSSQHTHSHHQVPPALGVSYRPRDRSSLNDGPPLSLPAFYQVESGSGRTFIGHQHTSFQSHQHGHSHSVSPPSWDTSSSSRGVSELQQQTPRDTQSRHTSFPFLSFLAAAHSIPSPLASSSSPANNDSIQAEHSFSASHDLSLESRRSSVLSSSSREQERSSGEGERNPFAALLRHRRLQLSGLNSHRPQPIEITERNGNGHVRQRAESSSTFPSPVTLPHERNAGSLLVPPLDRPRVMSPPLRHQVNREPPQSEQSNGRHSSQELLRLLYPEPPTFANDPPAASARSRHPVWGSDRSANEGINHETNRTPTLHSDNVPPILPPLQFESPHNPPRSGASSWASRNLETLRVLQDRPSSESRAADGSSGVDLFDEMALNSWRLWDNRLGEDTDRQRLHNMLTRRYRSEAWRDRTRDGETRETSSSGRTQGLYHTLDVYTSDGPNTTRHRHHDHVSQRTSAFDVWQRERERDRERERRERERRDRERERERQRQREARERERERLHDRRTLERALDPFGRWDDLSGNSSSDQRIDETLDIMSSDPVRRRPLQWAHQTSWDGPTHAVTPPQYPSAEIFRAPPHATFTHNLPSSGANRHSSQPHRGSDNATTHARPPSPPVNDSSPYFPGRRPRPRARFARHIGNSEDIHSTFLNVFRLRRRGSQRNLGDFVRDEDFDSSYEGLMALAATLGDVKSRSTPAHVISALPSGLYKDWQTADSDSRCPICLDDYKGLDPVLKAEPCNHWFHKECLEQWLHSARTCPVCRTKVNTSRTSTSPPVAGPSGTNRQGNASQSSTDNSDDDDNEDLLPLIDPAVPIAYHQLRRNNHPPL